MTNLESQGDIFGFINPFTDCKQLIRFLTTADSKRHESLPHDKENVDFVFSNFSFTIYLRTLLPFPNEHMTNLEGQGDILGFKNPLISCKQLFCFLTAADLHDSDSLPHNKENIEFRFFKNFIWILDHTSWNPSYAPASPNKHMTNLERQRDILAFIKQFTGF